MYLRVTSFLQKAVILPVLHPCTNLYDRSSLVSEICTQAYNLMVVKSLLGFSVHQIIFLYGYWVMEDGCRHGYGHQGYTNSLSQDNLTLLQWILTNCLHNFLFQKSTFLIVRVLRFVIQDLLEF